MKVNFPEKEKANVTRPCLVAACRGNENIANLLNYLIYEAQDLAEKTKVEANEITLQLTHDKMLNRPKNAGKRFNFSERSLIGYLRKLDEWKLVTNGKYERAHVVHIDEINKAIANPPAKPQGKPRGRRKSGNVEDNKTPSKRSTLLSQENVELKLKVEMLQKNVEMLQLKVEMFQDFVETFQLSKSSNGAQEAASMAKNRALYSVYTVDSVDFITGAIYQDDVEPVYPSLPEKKEVSSIEVTPPTQQAQPQHSYSQESTQPETESSRLQETEIPSQQELLPTEKPARKYDIPTDLRAGLNERDVTQPLSKKEQERIDKAEQDAKKRVEEKRAREIWLLFDNLFLGPVDRYGYNKAHVERTLATNSLATDEIITRAFQDIANSDAVKKDPRKLDITAIANVVPSYIRAAQIKVVENKPKKSIDEQIAENIREAEKYSPKARARREAQERMANAQ